MKQLIISLGVLLILSQNVKSQVSINADGTSPDNSAMLDVKSTSQGLLIPRMTMAQRNAIVSPATGLMVYQTDNLPGFYYNSGNSSTPVWVISGTGSGWGLTGNSGTSLASNFIGTTDNTSLLFRVNNQKSGGIDLTKSNTSLGYLTLNSNTNGQNNVAIGINALQSNLYGSNNSSIGANTLSHNTSGYSNTAAGSAALENNTEGYNNTGIGVNSLQSNTTGTSNCAIGAITLENNTTGSINTAIGNQSLSSNVDGWGNVAVGFSALYGNRGNSYSTAIGFDAMRHADNRVTGRTTYNTAIGCEALKGSMSYADNTGQWNTAVGHQSLMNNTSGNGNVATGSSSMLSNTTGSNNVAYGGNSMVTNTVGYQNTGIGNWALEQNTSGFSNTALGVYALRANTSGFGNIAIGEYALNNAATGNYCTSVGSFSGPSTLNLSNWSGFGYDAGSALSISNSIDLGNTSVTRIQGQVPMSLYSDERIKDNIVANVPGLDFILKLRPVTYNLNIHRQNEILYKGQKNTEDWTGKYDIEKIRMTGFIAQEVAKASADIGYDFNGVDKPETADGLYSLRYTEFVMPLVKAVQELNAVNESQNLKNEDLQEKEKMMQSTIDAMSQSIELLKEQNELLKKRIESLESR